MINKGWRKPTPDLGAARQHAQAGERETVSKTRAFLAVKRVGAHIGLKASDMMLLDALGAFTQPQDWEEGRRPIVWPSNALLMDQTGFSLSALKRRTRKLAEAGVIFFRDSSNGKRWGRRSADGVILEAYGIDLSPLAARVIEFECLHTELQAERRLCQTLKRQITIARRSIRANVDYVGGWTLTGPWLNISEDFLKLVARLPKRKVASAVLREILVAFTKLHEAVETLLDADCPTVDKATSSIRSKFSQTSETNTKGVGNEPHIPTTNELQNVSCNTGQAEDITQCTYDRATGGEGRDADKDAATQVGKVGRNLELRTLLRACPEFSLWARAVGGHLKDWVDFDRVAGQLGPMIGISTDTMRRARQSLGSLTASAALALVFEKHSAGEVTNPGGYLAGMIAKAGAGELHLERSFFGRLKALPTL